jgi:hypothetical protein
MSAQSRETPLYPPLDTLKPVADDVWIADSGPLSAMGVDIPVRMTAVRLSSGGVWLHSPTRYNDRLRREIEQLGPISHLVAPSVAHWMFLKDWRAHCPSAEIWAAPGLRQRAQVRQSGLSIDHDLGPTPPHNWAVDIDQVIVPGGFGFSEAAFLHRATRTLILTDLIQNFEPQKLHPLIRPLLRLAGATAPHGGTPAHLRFVVNRNREAAAGAARKVVAWEPERVIFAHGRWFERDGAAELRRALGWLVG